MLESFFWFIVICVILGLVTAPFSPHEPPQKRDGDEPIDPMVFWYEEYDIPPDDFDGEE
jgi:hypothetical protein